jgi:hypothetical protein
MKRITIGLVWPPPSMAINLRVLHRALVPIASVPLLLTAFTGAPYSVLKALEIKPRSG